MLPGHLFRFKQEVHYRSPACIFQNVQDMPFILISPKPRTQQARETARSMQQKSDRLAFLCMLLLLGMAFIYLNPFNKACSSQVYMRGTVRKERKRARCEHYE